MRRSCLLLAAAYVMVDGQAAKARSDATLTLASDDVFRGRSQSGGYPVGRATIGIDLPGGFYGGASGSVVLPADRRIALNGFEHYAGYARRLGPRRTLDVGIVTARYTGYGRERDGRGYTAVHAGLLGRAVAVRLSLSPDYFAARRTALYGEVDATPLRRSDWDVTIHGGWLAARDLAEADRDARYAPGGDWRVGVGRRLGRLRFKGALAGTTSARWSTRPQVSLSAAF